MQSFSLHQLQRLTLCVYLSSGLSVARLFVKSLLARRHATRTATGDERNPIHCAGNFLDVSTILCDVQEAVAKKRLYDACSWRYLKTDDSIQLTDDAALAN